MTETLSMLRQQDRDTLTATGLSYAASGDGGMTNLVLKNFAVAPGLSTDRVDLLLRLPLGFPDAAPDMFWVSPSLKTEAGIPIAGTEMLEPYVGRNWQRWSRHIAQHWRPGIDNLETYLAYVRQCLRLAGGR
ncbi:E2/UBC family protein [Mumia sp. DW29H23]|uniref:E2/UBC family protein n=1 Tax=Mumia sp. DW29H23 TaxID=3421241 RepID=UPI003D682BD4